MPVYAIALMLAGPVESLDRCGTWVCAEHNRWVRISTPEGDTLRPCPECGPVKVGKRVPLTGLTCGICGLPPESPHVTSADCIRALRRALAAKGEV